MPAGIVGGAGHPAGGAGAGGGWQHHLRRWAPTLLVCALTVWITCGLVLAAHLSVVERWRRASSPFLDEEDAAQLAGQAGRKAEPGG